jgi:hypothetical protein
MTSNLRRALMTCCVALILVGIVLLLNFTAFNPTGRRYSSSMPSTTITSNWRDAEIILERDLSIPFNDTAETRECICNSNQASGTVPGRCNVCLIPPLPISQNYSLPDFITRDLIADSKYVTTFSIDEQIQDFILAAQETNREVWIYVRTDTAYTTSTLDRIQATGGDIVPYFTVTDYYDPVDQIARILIVVGASGVVLVLGWEAWRWIQSQTPDEPEENIDTIDDATDTVDETENFMRRVDRLSRKELDKPDDTHRKR